MHIYNLTTGEWSELEMPEDHNLGSHFIHDGKLWCTYTPIDPTNQYKKGEERPESSVILYVYELDGSGGTRVAHDDLGSMNADESYIYMTSPVSYEAPASGQAVSSLPTRSLFFYDSQMNLIDEMSFDAFNQEEGELIIFNMFPLWGGKTLMLADYRNVNTYWYIDHAEVGTGNITPVEFLRYEGGDYSFTDNGGPRG